MKKSIPVFLILMMTFMATPPAGGAMFDTRPPEARSASRGKSASLMTAERAFVKGDYEEVVSIGNKYGRGRRTLDDSLLHITGRALLKLGRFGEARNCFSRIINNSESDKLLDGAYIGLADSYYLEGNYENAKSHYENAVAYIPDSDEMPVVYYKLGECYAKLGDKSSSKEYYDKLQALYPYSLEAGLLSGGKSDFIIYSVQVGSFKKWARSTR